MISDYLRQTHGVKGEVVDFGDDGQDGTITYKSPGYSADVFFDTASGDYTLTTYSAGFVGVMNDLHKGRDSSSLWRWVIDLSGGLLVVVALTGIGIQLFLRKRRVRALALSVAGSIAAVVLIWLAAR